MENIAHVAKNEEGAYRLHSLLEHLNKTAKKANEFASLFDASEWAEIAGLWHDLGKFLPKWQNYLQKASGYEENAHIEGFSNRPNHSTAGAVLAFKQFGQCGLPKLKADALARIIGYIVAGHHAGLPDWDQDYAGGDLLNRIYKDPLNGLFDLRDIEILEKIDETNVFMSKSLPKSSPLNVKNNEEFQKSKEHLHLWVRMLFSCLVDADFLDTERFMDPGKYEIRSKYPQINELKKKFDSFINRMKSESAKTPINNERNKILEICRKK
ncbi:MAG: CRISPR-associated endonuclease Cas3'', partial [Chitinivibrionales bacterium]|nr:CRISPR-associated endonuclease Cas3'' [Chitinivibrionales bacterium]